MQSPFGRNTGRYPRENVQAWDKVDRARFPIRDMTLFPLSVRHARIKDIFICACETVFPGYARDETVVLRDHLIVRRISLAASHWTRITVVRRI